MIKAESVHSTPRIVAPNFPPPTINLLTQEQARQTALLSLARLRKEASDQIEQLLIFLDVIDGYTIGECEPNGDELDASYPEGCQRLLTHHGVHEDAEDDDPAEEHEPSGIADREGLYEQIPSLWGHAYV